MKQRKGRVISGQGQDKEKTRKQLRKQKKVEKKQKKRLFYQTKLPNYQQTIPPKYKNQPQQQPKSNRKEIVVQKIKTAKVVKPTVRKQVEETEDDKIIKLYEEKLGITQGKDKYNKIAKQFGMDDDIFDFLHTITNKNHTNRKYPPNQQEAQEDQLQQHQQNQEMEYIQQEVVGSNEQGQDFDQEYDEMFDNLGQQNLQQSQQNGDEANQQIQQQPIEVQQQQIEEQQPIPSHSNRAQQPTSRRVFRKDAEATPEQQQIRKSMNSLFNKLSDGNILPSFRQFMRIIESYPRSSTVPIYSQLFVRFNLMIQKPLFHIMATNIALVSALHYAFGNRVLGPVLHCLTQRYLELSREKDNELQVSEIGYSKRFQRMKNYATIVSLLYNYGSISGDYIESFVQWLTQSLDKNNIELLYIIIQKCGVKVRQNDPSILKNIISIIKDAIEGYKQSHSSQAEQMQKINFIELELTEIKFNKKSQLSSDQRMAFLQTFITKNVPKEIEAEKEVFPLTFQQLMQVDASHTNWWNGNEENVQILANDGNIEIDQNMLQLTQQKRELVQLAKSFHMVTEAKKNIFICLMDSKDYLEATQRILQLKLKNYQDVATVLVQVCTLEPNFNPYYPLVAAKIASLMPKFRLNLQYSIWDHLKLLAQYELRRTSNLAKFVAKLISDPLSNCSLSILKFYPDLSNVRAIDSTFLQIMLAHFFKKVNRDYLSKLVSKLREENNRNVKEGIKELLGEIEFDQEVKQKVKLCRRLLMIELDPHKAEDGDLLT